MGKITPRFFLAVFIFGMHLLSANTVLANIKYGPEKPISEKQIQDKSFFVGFLLEEEPTITAPSDINGVNKPGECFALKSNINLGNATFSGSSNSPTNDAPTEFPVGSTTVTWTVTDDSGNTATDTQLVNITDSENPEISLGNNISKNTDDGKCTASIAIPNATFSDNCSEESLSWIMSGATSGSGNGQVGTYTFNIGTTTIDYTVTDAAGNNISDQIDVVVEDNEKPIISAPADVTVDTDNNECTASSVSLGTPTTGDNCEIKNITNDAPSVFSIGKTTVIWTVTDNADNTASITQKVTVEDKQAPFQPTIPSLEWTCEDEIINFPTTTDNCNGEITGTTSDPLSYDTYGTYTITWKFTDDSENSVTATQEIIIPEPTVEIPVINNSAFCNTEIVPEINFSGANATSYQWSYQKNSSTDIGLASSGTGNIPAFTAKNNSSEPIIVDFTVIPFGGNCQGEPKNFQITINPTPTITKPENIVVCAGETIDKINFPGASVSGTSRVWINDNTSIGLSASGQGNIESFTATNSTTQSITATITLTPTANNCEGISETFTITVKPKPEVAQFPTAQVYCNGETTEALNLESTVTGTTFNISGGSAIGLSNRTNVAEIPSFTATTGTATLTITPVVNGCTGEPVTYEVTVNPTPSLSVNPSSQQICSGETTSINLSGSADSFSWTISELGSNITGATEGTGNSIAQSLTNSGTQPQVVKYKITPEANGCSGTPITVAVTVNPLPEFEVNIPECETSVDLTDPSIKISSFSNLTYTYWTNPEATSPLQNPSEVSLGTYHIKGTTASGCSVIKELVIDNIQPVLTSSTTPPDICSNTVFNYSPESNLEGTTYSWTRAAVNGISNPEASSTEENKNNPNEILNNTTTNSIEVTYVYTLKSQGECVNTQTVKVNVKPTPMLQDQDYGSELCSGDLFEYIPQSTLGGTNFTWERRSTNGSVQSSGNGSISERLINDTENNIVFTYYYTLSNSSCSNPEEFSVSVTVLPTFQVEASASRIEICPGESIDLFSSTELVQDLEETLLSENFNSSTNWSPNNAGSATWSRQNNYAPPEGGGTINSGSGSFAVANKLNLNPNSNISESNLISPAFSTQGYTSLTLDFRHFYRDVRENWGDFAVIDYSLNNGASWNVYEFFNNSQGSPNNFENFSDQISEIIGHDQVRIRFRFLNQGSDARAYSWAIDDVTITGEIQSTPEVEWTSNTDGDWTSNEQNPTNITPGGTTVYTVKYTDPDLECPGRASVEVVVRQPPNPTITANYCGDSQFIELVSDNDYSSYRWEANGELLGTERTLDVEIAKTYTLTVTDDLGCEGTGYINVSNELITNGDFEEGNEGFYTEYNYKPNPTRYSNNNQGTSALWPEQTYAISNDARQDPYSWHPNFYGQDHTYGNGNGNFMLINGAPASGKVVWRQTIENIQPNTNYYFNAWGMNLNPSSPARLQFKVNGVNTGTIAELSQAATPTSNGQVDRSNWVQFYSNPFWNSGNSTTAVLEIVNLNTNTGGNDFGLDDISFGTLEQIVFEIDPDNNSILCEGEELELYANIDGGRFPITFEWTGPAGSDFSNKKTVNTLQELNDAVTLKIPDITAEMAGTYTLEVTDFYGCTAKTGTTEVKVLKINAGDDQTVCSNTAAVDLSGQISGSNNGGTWSTSGSGTFSNNQALDATYTPSENDIIAENGVTLTLTSNDPEATCTDEILINFNDAPEATVSATPVSCFEANDGTATVTVTAETGTAPFTYEWLDENGNTSQTTQTATGLAPNPNGYTVIVTDSNGCSTTLTSAAIEEPTALEIVETTHTNVTCFGGSDGSATLEVTGGFVATESPGYILSLLDKDGNEVMLENPNNSGIILVENLMAGVYTFTANTTNACSLLSETITIDQPLEIIVDAGEPIEITECGVTSAQLNALPVDPELGEGTWSYTSSDGGSGNFENPNSNITTFHGDSGKNYTLSWTVTPNNGCTLAPASLDFTFPPTCSKLNFDGDDDYVNAGNNYTMAGSDFSIEAWVKPHSTSGVNTIISKRIEGEANKGYDLILNNGAPTFRVRNRSVTTINKIKTDRWYHIAGIYTSSKMSLYVDGIEIQSNTNNIPNGSGNFDAPFLIGAANSPATTKGTKDHFNGFIEEVRLWEGPISREQIRFFMNQRLAENGTNVSGTILGNNLNLPNAPKTISWSNLLGYYQLLAQDNLISDGFTDNLGSVGKTANGLLKNIQLMQENTAPLPYILNKDDEIWFTKTTWNLPPDFSGLSEDFRLQDVWDAPGSKGINGDPIEWNIVKLNGKSVENSAENNISLLALIDEGGTLTMRGVNNDSGSGLNITHYFELNGHIDLNGESQLVQPEGSMLKGSGYLTRDQQGTASSYNYNYWSSPVVSNTGNQSYTIASVMHDGTEELPKKLDIGPTGHVTYADGPATPDNIPKKISGRWLYKFRGDANQYSEWEYVGKDGTLLAGEGYTMKGTSGVENSGEFTPINKLQNYTFRGFPNNGPISLTVGEEQNYLLGNPYPSALEARQFILDNLDKDVVEGATNNENIFNGALYFWDHFGGNTHILREYVGGYATINLSGAVQSASSIDERIKNDGSNGTKKPGSFIPVGQGFFVNTVLDPDLAEGINISGGNIIFNNGQRAFATEANTNDSQFLKPIDLTKGPKTVKTKDSRYKIRLNFTSPLGFQREILVTADSYTTNGFDLGYDALLNDNISEDMYWLIKENKFVIQGVPNFNLDQKLPIGLKIAEEKEFSIKLGELENVPDIIDIYLRDNSDSTYHDLRKEAFKASLPAGEYQDLYEIVFHDVTSNRKDKEPGEGLIDYYYSLDNREFVISNPELHKIEHINIYNIAGQLVDQHFGIPDLKEIHVPQKKSLSSAVYIVKVYTDSGDYAKKVIIRKD